MKNPIARILSGVALACSCLFAAPSQAETDPKYYAVEASATVQTSPAAITLTWVQDPNATGYTIYRKALSSSSWSIVANAAGSATTWTDYNVAVGSAFEYRFDKTTSVGYRGNGFIYAGVNAPMIEGRGKVLLLVDNTFTTSLSTELARLQQDLVGDGWTVLRKDFARNETVANIKSFIKTSYNADPNNTKAVFIFGHLAVPYSGNYAPDGHVPDHVGAWPADAFYGDVNGNWTDSSVYVTGAHRAANNNVPGDGKFDQSSLPSDVELYVGRVDLYNMTCYANKTPSRSETDLMRQYLNKDHNFRHKKINVARRGLVSDNFGETGGEAFAASGWRAFAPFFGAGTTTKISWGTFFPTLNTEGYLWAYGTGGGSYYTCNGVGGSDDFAINDPKAVFTAFLGSYFGDWDNESNFLRAHLGTTTYGLTAVWAGRPHWFFHHMGLGEPIGMSTKVSQNNNGLYPVAVNWCARNVHTALMGDPTLRLHPVAPPVNVSATLSGSTASVTWNASPDSAIVGYHVYKGASAVGSFTRLTSAPVTTTSFSDSSSAAGAVYMVRAVKLEQGGSGTYYNPSQGIFATAGTSSGGGTPMPEPTPVLPAAPTSLAATVLSSSQINLSWRDNASNEAGFVVERRTGSGSYSVIATLAANTVAFANTGLTASTAYTYRVRAYTTDGYSAYTAEVAATTAALPEPTPVLPSAPTSLFVAVVSSSQINLAWKDNAHNEAGFVVERRAGSGAYSVMATPTANIVSFADTGRAASTPYTYRVRAFSADGYSAYTAEVTGTTAAIPVASAGPVAPSHVKAAATSAAEIAVSWRDNSSDENVFLLERREGVGAWGVIGKHAANATSAVDAGLKAGTTYSYRVRAYNPDGYSAYSLEASAATPAGETDPVAAHAEFVSRDTTTRGDWKNVYGSEGAMVIGESSALPAYATVTPSGHASYVWQWSAADPRALQRPASDERIAACWYSGGSFGIDVRILDGKIHPLAVHFVDWDSGIRSQRVELMDLDTGSILDTQTISNFSQGVYLVWNIKGNIRLRVTTLQGNAVVSGIFFGEPTPQEEPQSIAAAAKYVATDRVTQGSWTSSYGADGVAVAGDTTQNAPYATINVAGASPWTWSQLSGEARCLQRASAPSARLAACWYAPSSFTLDVPVKDSGVHRLAIYCLDWDQAGRAQTFEVLDAKTGALLDFRSLASFTQGAYLVWDIQGSVKIRITRTSAGGNAVASGVFLSPAPTQL